MPVGRVLGAQAADHRPAADDLDMLILGEGSINGSRDLA